MKTSLIVQATILSLFIAGSEKAHAVRNGAPVAPAEYKAVGFVFPNCTGTFINANTYITAAHCLARNVRQNRITIGEGDEELTLTPRPNGVRILSTAYNTELALVRTEGEVPLSKFPRLSKVRPRKGELATGVGFGATGDIESRGDKLQGRYLIESVESVNLGDGSGPGTMIIVAPATSKNQIPCAGDSGGPLFSKSGELVGIVSFGVGRPDDKEFDTREPNVDQCLNTARVYYVSTADHVAWIEDMLAEFDQ